MIADPSVLPAPQPLQGQDALALMATLADEFRTSAIERDQRGGTPKAERDRIRASGLLRLVIPRERGGHGASWITAFQLSRTLASVDASLAHVYSYHNLGVVLPTLFGSQDQREQLESATVREGWWWGNALNPLDRRLQLVADGQHWRLQGHKRFCSGSHDAEILPVGAVDSVRDELVVVVVPADREGIQLHDDWDAIGQRQTDSGSVSFNNVHVSRTEVLGRRSPGASPFQALRACLTQLNLAHLFIGIAEGGLDEARSCLRGQTELVTPTGGRVDDPHVGQLFGELWLQLQAAKALVEQAAVHLQRAWERGPELSDDERGQCALRIAAAKVAASRAGHEVTSRLFDLVGARGVSRGLGLDRHWRNWRTLSLHDPDSRKVEALGAWGLKGQLPAPDFYL